MRLLTHNLLICNVSVSELAWVNSWVELRVNSDGGQCQPSRRRKEVELPSSSMLFVLFLIVGCSEWGRHGGERGRFQQRFHPEYVEKDWLESFEDGSCGCTFWLIAIIWVDWLFHSRRTACRVDRWNSPTHPPCPFGAGSFGRQTCVSSLWKGVYHRAGYSQHAPAWGRSVI